MEKAVRAYSAARAGESGSEMKARARTCSRAEELKNSSTVFSSGGAPKAGKPFVPFDIDADYPLYVDGKLTMA